MTFDFFALPEDQMAIANYVLTQLKLRVFDLYSAYESEIVEYVSAETIIQKLNSGSVSTTFQLWSPALGPFSDFQKIQLDPKRCKGHTFRYSAMGLGLLQLYFGEMAKGFLHKSHISHFSEKQAKAYAHNFIHGANEWNWDEVTRLGRSLRTFIRKKAVTQWNGYDVLQSASLVGNYAV